jgi:hypothetical protein
VNGCSHKSRTNLNFYCWIHSPTTMGDRKPPRFVEMFHRPQYVPRSLAANHLVSSIAHAGAPIPCTQQHQHGQECETGMQNEHVGSCWLLCSNTCLGHIQWPRPTDIQETHIKPLRCGQP